MGHYCFHGYHGWVWLIRMIVAIAQWEPRLSGQLVQSRFVKVTTVSCSSFKVANMLVVGSMVGSFKLSTTFSVSSVGMTMFSSLCCHGYGRYQL